MPKLWIFALKNTKKMYARIYIYPVCWIWTCNLKFDFVNLKLLKNTRIIWFKPNNPFSQNNWIQLLSLVSGLHVLGDACTLYNCTITKAFKLINLPGHLIKMKRLTAALRKKKTLKNKSKSKRVMKTGETFASGKLQGPCLLQCTANLQCTQKTVTDSHGSTFFSSSASTQSRKSFVKRFCMKKNVSWLRLQLLLILSYALPSLCYGSDTGFKLLLFVSFPACAAMTSSSFRWLLIYNVIDSLVA